MTEFLRTVVRHYLPQLSGLAASRWLFVFPNRRSQLFFSRYYDQEVMGRTGQPAVACRPATTTIGDFFADMSDSQVADRMALLFRLFDIYQARINAEKGAQAETFDSFVHWGDLLLSDFEDVDRSLADARQVFTVVRDLKTIDQRFGELPEETVLQIRKFWTSFSVQRADDKRRTFVQTWEILYDLYENFRKSLMDEGLAYGGMQQRQVIETIKQRMQTQPDPLEVLHGMMGMAQCDHIVFVGLTALSRAEFWLMQWLQRSGIGQCCWDYAEPLTRPDSPLASPSYFSRRYLDKLPNALSYEELDKGRVADRERELRLYAASSGVGQSEVVRRQLMEWQHEAQLPGSDLAGITTSAGALRTAIVLPDEHQLLPVLYALPQGFDVVNVTMGYGLRQTPIASLVNNLARLQLQIRYYEAEGRGPSFYYKAVLPILSHSFIMSLSGEPARTLIRRIRKDNLYQVPLDLVREANDPLLSMLLRPVTSGAEVGPYLLRMLETFLTNEEAFTDVDREFFREYRLVVERLLEEVSRLKTDFSPQTFFLLLDRLVAGVSVPFSGEPLSGLQVMGVLETRALDFDNLIILSMNEGVFPAKPPTNTYIPMSLRYAFGLPTRQHRDAVYAYHFHRLLCRARRVTLVYDCHADGLQSGEESRYVKQLRFLMNRPGLTARAVTDDIGMGHPVPFEVQKTPRIQQILNRYLAGGDLNLSASAIKTYLQCPLAFYLSNVEQISEEREVTESLDSAQFGTVLHAALETLYARACGQIVQADNLQHLIKNPEGEITSAVLKAFHDKLGISNLEGYNQILAEVITIYVTSVLRFDKQHCTPMTYLSNEASLKTVYATADNELHVNMKAIFDRLDMRDGMLRVVDYKTSSSKDRHNIPSVERLFARTMVKDDCLEAMQVLLYCLLLQHSSDDELARINLTRQQVVHIQPHLYHVRDMSTDTKAEQTMLRNGTTSGPVLPEFEPLHQEVRTQFDDLLHEIFNPNIPFRQADIASGKCAYCFFNQVCKR